MRSVMILVLVAQCMVISDKVKRGHVLDFRLSSTYYEFEEAVASI